jgi:hypothetical protein
VELVRDTDIQPADPADNLPPALLAARTHLVLNGRQVIHGQAVRGMGPRRAAAPAPAPPAASAAAGTPLAPPSGVALAPPHSGGEGSAPGSSGVLPASSADAQALAEVGSQAAQPCLAPLLCPAAQHPTGSPSPLRLPSLPASCVQAPSCPPTPHPSSPNPPCSSWRWGWTRRRRC